MRILLTTEFVDAPSTEIYRRLLQEMNESTGSLFHFGGRDYENYDVIIFMGYDPDFVQARKVNPKATIGIIDVRPASGIPLAGADFLLANGVEMKDFWAGSIPHACVLPMLGFWILYVYRILGPGLLDQHLLLTCFARHIFKSD